jgi:hypothetical protein
VAVQDLTITVKWQTRLRYRSQGYEGMQFQVGPGPTAMVRVASPEEPGGPEEMAGDRWSLDAGIDICYLQ